MSPQTSPTSQHAAAVSSPTTAKPTAVADDTASQHSSSSSSVFSLFPSGRLRIAHVFGLQVLFVAACFSFTLAYLFVSLRTEIDNNTNQIISGVMQQYQDAMTPPLFSATYVALRLHDELPLRNLLIPQLPNNTISSHLTTYSAYKQGMRELPFCDYIYEDYKTSDYDAFHSLNYWDEAVCGLKSCYRVTNNSAVLITIPTNDGWVPSNFSQATRDNPEYLTFQPNVEGYYINTIRSIPVNNTEGMWGVPYVWLEDTIDHIFPLQSFLVCFGWNTTASECTHSLTIEMNMQRLSEALQTIISADASSTALVHMNTLRLISNTLPGMTLINMTGLTNFDNLYGTSLLTSRMWNAFHTPSEMLTKAMYTFFASCVMSRQFDRTIGVTDLYSYEYSQMSYIAAIDDQIVGMRIIELSSDTQYLFLVFTPRSYFYASTDRALRNAIIVAVVVSVVVVGIVMLLFFSVSSAMRSLLDNIMVAESLDYERVTETPMILYETQRVHDAFLALNARLLQTRAFLPQSIFEKGLGANPQRNSAAMNEKELFSEPEDEEMMLAGHASRNTTQANPFTNAAVVPAASSPDQIDNNEAQQAYVSFVDSVKDVEGQQSPSTRREKLSSVSVYPRPRRLNLSSSLASRRVTVACCNIVGTHASFGSRGPAETQRQLGIVLGAIERAVEVERGVIDLYHGDRVMVSFNASTVLTSSGPRAARTILRVCKELDEPGVPAVRWGVSTGNAVVGNFGTNRTRRFCVCGPVVNQAFALMLHCRAEGVLNLVAPLTYDLIKDDFVVEHRNLVALTIGGSHTAPTIISTILRERSQSLSTSRWSNSTSPPAVVQSDAPVTTNMDEETLDKLNRAFEALERGEVADAFTLASELPRDLGKRLRQILDRCSEDN